DLQSDVTEVSYVYMLSNVAKRFLNDEALGPSLIAEFGESLEPLSADRALLITNYVACWFDHCDEHSWERYKTAGMLPDAQPEQGVLNRGEMYALAAAIAGMSFE